MNLTKEHINSKIKSTSYLVLPDGRTTVCQITMKNGFSVHGTSSVLDPGNFSIDIGRQVAYDDAFRRIWDLEAYVLMQQAHDTKGFEESSNEMKISLGDIHGPIEQPQEAPYGYKRDGSPRARPGRKKT